MNFAYYEIVEDCIEAKNVYDGFLNIHIKEKFINYLGNLGKLVFQKDFDIPYFKVIVRGKFTIKGNLDDFKFRLLLPDEAGIEDLDFIKKYINEFE